MANVTPLRDNTDPIRATRAAFVHNALKDERWSIRAAALAIGISHSALGDRANGQTAFLADELEQIAGLLKRDPVDFYRDYINASENQPRDYMAATPGILTRVDFTARKVVA